MSSLHGKDLVIDSNIINYYFDKNTPSEGIISNFVEDNFIHISIMSEIEVLGFELAKEGHDKLTSFFEDINSYPISSGIKRKSIFLKRFCKLKTVDSIIAPTAWNLGMPFVWADKVFSRIEEIQFIQCEIYISISLGSLTQNIKSRTVQ